MSQYRVFSMLAYGAAALVGMALLSSTTIPGAVAVGLPFALAAGADRFINRHAEPDDRLRSFAIYGLGAVGGLLVLAIFGSRLGWWAFAAPVVGFGVAALFEYYRPPKGYEPADPHRYGASPPVTQR
jgi:hypothetical protein